MITTRVSPAIRTDGRCAMRSPRHRCLWVGLFVTLLIGSASCAHTSTGDQPPGTVSVLGATASEKPLGLVDRLASCRANGIPWS